jgi:phage terminase Nu1 subunit (DNA packaging protein)
LAEPVQPKDIAKIVSEIPSFTERRVTAQAVPTVRVISREIRRAKSKLANLERLRDAVRVVGRHKHLVQQLVNAEVENGKA